MTVSSRTPEGHSGRCSICNQDIRIEPSIFPVFDATCPNCGTLIQFESVPSVACFNILEMEEREESTVFDIFDRVFWILIAVVTTSIVLIYDESVLVALVWLAGVLMFSQWILPNCYARLSGFVHNENKFWLSVVLGWAITAGLPMGAVLGVLIPIIIPIEMTSFVGGLIGLVIGPLFAAAQGLTLAWIVGSIFRMFTGRGLTKS